MRTRNKSEEIKVQTLIRRGSMLTGYVLYEGPSAYDGVPIVVIATSNSKNTKTGRMWQTWIMLQDVAPHEAVKTGADYSVCGNCPLRPLNYKANGLAKPCYVLTFQAPLSVWRKYKRGGYPHIALSDFRQVLQGASIRLGSWGDPATVQFKVWQALGIGSGEFTHTSYTHGYLVDGFDDRNLQISMVSIDPVTELLPELPTGRSFRVISSVDQLQQGEILCPASKEQGYRTTCSKCGLCGGQSRKAKNIAIVIH